jgi:hypothetical protein
MVNATQLYSQLKDLSQRHANLKKKFSDFFAAAGYLSSGESSIQGLTFEDHLDENYFNVMFCGQTFQFRFSLALDQTGSSRGAVSCFGVDPADPSKQKLILAFTFSGTGAADIEKPDGLNDPITVNDDVGAIFLVCYCIHSGLIR